MFVLKGKYEKLKESEQQNLDLAVMNAKQATQYANIINVVTKLHTISKGKCKNCKMNYPCRTIREIKKILKGDNNAKENI